MTLPVPARIADAVAASLNAAVADNAFETLGWTATRRYFDWAPDYSDLSGLAVDVLYRTTSPADDHQLRSFGKLEYKIGVDVVVRKRFSPSDRETSDGRLKNASVDALVFLVQEIFEHFVALRRNSDPLTTEPDAVWRGIDLMSYCTQAMLRESCFEGVVRLEFDLERAL